MKAMKWSMMLCASVLMIADAGAQAGAAGRALTEVFERQAVRHTDDVLRSGQNAAMREAAIVERNAARAMEQQAARQAAEAEAARVSQANAVRAAAADRAAREATAQANVMRAQAQVRMADAPVARPPPSVVSARADFAKVRDPGVVYARINPTTGEHYVGRSKSTSAYLQRQAAHDRAHGTSHVYTVAKTAQPGTSLQVAEETGIRQMGGVKSLANKRVEMSEARYRAAGGRVPAP